MKHLVTAAGCLALVAIFMVTSQSQAQTLVVYANGPTLNKVIMGDTLANGARAHTAYQLVSLDTTYLMDGTITMNSDLTIIGVPNATTGRPPCIQPDVLLDNSIPGTLFSLNGKRAKGTFKNLYLLGRAINNAANGDGVAILVSGDSVRLEVDNVVFDEWQTFAIGYNGNYDKFFVTNSKFRNMVHPNQWYIGEALRNTWPGEVATDSVVFKFNTFFCLNGYASAPVSKYLVKYFEFSHNSVIYTFKNPMFVFNVTKAKINDNIWYGTYAGGVSKAENPWWDNLWYPDESYGVVSLQPLDSAKIRVFAPALPAKPAGVIDTAAEQLRVVEMKNNAYFWPATLTSFWTAWNDTAHVDSIYTPVWMNTRTTNMFADGTTWPGLTESGNQSADPGYGASIPGVLTQSTNNLLDWFRLCRTNLLTNTYWGYQKTQVGAAVNWVPPWPLPEAADMKYSNTSLKTAGTDGRPLGDPYWFNGTSGGPTGVEESAQIPNSFALLPAYPNPFNPSTSFRFTLQQSGVVTLKVYNIMGQVVATIINNENWSAGIHTVTVDLSHAASGVYIGVLEQGTNRAFQKLTLLK
jgi:hypothetical protein